MKVAVVRRRFSSFGGAELYGQRLLESLCGAGHKVHLLTEGWDKPPAAAAIHLLKVGGGRAERPLNFALAVQAELAREPFDCVFSLERTLRQDVYRAGEGVHRVWLERRAEFRSLWRRLLPPSRFHEHMLRLEEQTFQPRNTGRIIVNSEMVRQEIVTRFHFPEARIHLVRNGIATERLQSGRRAATRARLGIADDEFVLLFVGSGWERKGLPFLIRALRFWPEKRVKLVVVGRGRRPLHSPSKIIYAGVMNDVENAYAAADLFILLPIYDPCANACLEAWAAGLPVVTTPYNGAGELIEQGINGTLVAHPADADAVVAAIHYWMSRPLRRPVRVRNDLRMERNVAETLEVLERAVRDKRS